MVLGLLDLYQSAGCQKQAAFHKDHGTRTPESTLTIVIALKGHLTFV